MQLILANVKDVVFISKKVYENEKDGQKNISYYISVESNDNVGSLPCTLEVFNSLSDVPKYTPINIALVFDTFRREFKVINAVVVNK